MTELNYEFSEYGFSVTANISTHKEFVECTEFIKTPFSDSTTIMPNDFNYEDYEQIVVRCYLPETEELKIIQLGQSSQKFCVNIIEKYVDEKWRNREIRLYKTITCNPKESQFMYLIRK